MPKFLILSVFIIVSNYSFGQQKQLQVNGKPVNSNDCAEIRKTPVISDTLVGLKVDVKDAQITGDCLDLTIVYGGCNANIELITDNKVNDQSNPKLYFRL